MRRPEFETTDEDWRGMEIWLIYGALLRTPNYGDKLNYAIPYGRANRETHPRCAWINELSRRYAAQDKPYALDGDDQVVTGAKFNMYVGGTE